MQTKVELEQFYKKTDPWGFQENADDIRRKSLILGHLNRSRFKRALDIGCGEGWISKDLPADEIHGFELSDQAAARLPASVKRVIVPEGRYDLIVATGVLYSQYDWRRMLDMIRQHACGVVLTCNIKNWERPETTSLPHQYHEEEFPYREYIQKLRLFDFSSVSEAERAAITFGIPGLSPVRQAPTMVAAPAPVDNLVLLHNITTGSKPNSNYNTRDEIRAATGRLTFDGVYKNVYEHRDVLRGKNSILFVTGAYVGKDNSFDVGMPREMFCDWNEIMELVIDFGCKLGWHTWTHPDLTRLSAEEALREIKPPFPMDYFAYPYGRYNASVINAVKAAGFKDAWSVTQGNGQPFQRRRNYL